MNIRNKEIQTVQVFFHKTKVEIPSAHLIRWKPYMMSGAGGHPPSAFCVGICKLRGGSGKFLRLMHKMQ